MPDQPTRDVPSAANGGAFTFYVGFAFLGTTVWAKLVDGRGTTLYAPLGVVEKVCAADEEPQGPPTCVAGFQRSAAAAAARRAPPAFQGRKGCSRARRAPSACTRPRAAPPTWPAASARRACTSRPAPTRRASSARRRRVHAAGHGHPLDAAAARYGRVDAHWTTVMKCTTANCHGGLFPPGDVPRPPSNGTCGPGSQGAKCSLCMHGYALEALDGR